MTELRPLGHKHCWGGACSDTYASSGGEREQTDSRGSFPCFFAHSITATTDIVHWHSPNFVVVTLSRHLGLRANLFSQEANDIQFDPEDLTKKLLPVLHSQSEIKATSALDYGRKLVAECKIQIAKVLPLNSTEMEFLDLLLDKGDIKPELLTNDSGLQQKIRSHPLLHWKAFNVRKHKGITVDQQESL